MPDPVATILQDGMRHHGRGDLAAAEVAYRKVLKRHPRHPVALQLLGVAAQQRGNTPRAIDLIRKALQVAPNFAEAHFNLGNVYKAADRLEEAAAAFEKAAALKPGYADAFGNLGATLQLLGRNEAALECCRKVVELEPENPVALNNLGAALHRLGQGDQAVPFYRRAIALAPTYAEAHCNMGAALVQFDRLAEGRAAFEKAIEIKPDYVQAHANLAELFEKANDAEALRGAVDAAKRHCPPDLRIALREAWLLRREKKQAEARALLEDERPQTGAGRQAFDNRYVTARAHLLGDICDRLNDPAAAFAYFEEGNRLNRASRYAQKFDASGPKREVDQLLRHVTADWVQGWRPLAPNDDGRADPVFLVGFPRSGTTLLDSILRSHPGIAVVEEQPTVLRLQNALIRSGRRHPEDGTGNGLAELTADEVQQLRDVYFGELARHLEPGDDRPVVVDKLPLNSLNAGLIHRILPKARFIFAKRHPCDCVLSCFMREFELNDYMAVFLDFEEGARFYDKTMTLWHRFWDLLSLQVQAVAYEDVVNAFEETLKPLIAFLDLPWDPALHDYAETARQRKRIHTPSYFQVTQPLYREARYRWERYRDQMAPVLPLLAPWVERLGYSSLPPDAKAAPT